ncbi:MAG TPA: SDR family oxidoreductase, partial [Mycobacterium sp.]
MDHHGTTALITGASSGLGAAFAQQLAERGANLVLVARSRDRLELTAKELRAEHGVDVTVYDCDLSQPGAGTTLAQRLADDGARVDTLINNAGVGTHGDFAAQDPGAITAQVQLNVAAVVDLTRALLPWMLSSGRGALVNIASTSAYQPTPSMAVYGASKAFVLSFTEALAYEHRRSGLRILAVSPGPMRTPFFDVLGTTRPGVGRWQTPEAVAEQTLRTLDRRMAPPSIISGTLNAIPVFDNRFAPRRLVLAITGKAIG